MLVVIFIVVSCNMVSDVKLLILYAVADMLSRSQLENPPSIGRQFVKRLDVNN